MLSQALAAYRRSLGFREHDVRVDGLRMVYLETGRGAPLVLLHGLGADKDHFLFLARRLRRHFRVIVPDLPGFGASDRPGDIDYGVSAQVERVRGFVEALGLPRVALGGNSMGGFIAGAFAATHPGMVERLWLMAPAGVAGAEPSPLLKQLEAGGSPQILARSYEEFEQARRFVMARPNYLPRFLVKAMAQRQIHRYDHHLRVLEHLGQSDSLEQRFADPPRLPTLVVWGEADRALDVSGAEVLGQMLPASEVIRLPEIGHLPQVEAPKRLARDWLDFTQRTR